MKKLLTFLFTILFSVTLFSQTTKEFKTNRYDYCDLDFKFDENTEYDCEISEEEVSVSWKFLYNEDGELWRVVQDYPLLWEPNILDVDKTYWVEIHGQDILTIHANIMAYFFGELVVLESYVLMVNFDHRVILVIVKEDYLKQGETKGGFYY